MKTQTKHTPGPWEVLLSDGGLSEEGNRLILGPNPGYQGQRFIARTNATDSALIAAAPDLLEAAKEWLGIIEENQYDDIQPGPTGRLRAAIVKAEGKCNTYCKNSGSTTK